MWDLDTIKQMNAEQPKARQTGPRQGVFEIRDAVFALGYRGARALATVARVGHGDYVGIRGRRPLIHREARRLEKHEVSDALNVKLHTIAARA